MQFIITNGKQFAEIAFDTRLPSWYYANVQGTFTKEFGGHVDLIRIHPQDSVCGVSYLAVLAGPDGMNFCLVKYPEVTNKMLADAKRRLRADRDVVRFTVLRLKERVEFTPPFVHPLWCIEAAEAITGNKYCDRDVFIPTNLGDKSTQGIADIIFKKWEAYQ